MGAVTPVSLEARLARVEARLEIQQLPVRYALAIDQRDLDGCASLFVPDVPMGRHGHGRAAFRNFMEPRLRWFYRSMHQICGHGIDLGADMEGEASGPNTATGQVYCRAEHEVGERWIVMAIRYDDTYRRVDGRWLFARRRERHWYAADMLEHPQSVGFDSWGTSHETPGLPAHERTWGAFWSGFDTSDVTSAR